MPIIEVKAKSKDLGGFPIPSYDPSLDPKYNPTVNPPTYLEHIPNPTVPTARMSRTVRAGSGVTGEDGLVITATHEGA